jgi:DNA-binding transcriptional ArsR family regulator
LREHPSDEQTDRMARPIPHPDGGTSPSGSAGGAEVSPEEGLLIEAAETFAMLASPIRLHLLWLLAHGGKDVGTLADAVGASVATVSQHLAKLRLSDLVSARRQGKYQMYEVDDPHVVALVQQALDHHADLQSRARPRRVGGDT